MLLLPVGTPSRDDANDLVFRTLKLDGVSYQQKQNSSDHAKRLPTALPAFDAIMIDQGVGIIEDVPRQLETHAVFPLVCFRFCRIPLKPNHETYNSITPIV
jgi:hypothetical protein